MESSFSFGRREGRRVEFREGGLKSEGGPGGTLRIEPLLIFKKALFY